MPALRAILTYHSLDDSGSVVSTAPTLFSRQMDALKTSGVKVTGLLELLRHPGPAVAITFDDGFANFAEIAAPVLTQHGFPATIFLVTDYCGGRNDWPSQWTNVPRLPLMDWTRIRELSDAGFSFGAHTATHPDLTRMPESDARREILASKQRIEEVLGRAVDAFAYPYGAASSSLYRLVAEHFGAGCSTHLGFVRAASRLEDLERLDVYYLRRPYWFRRLFGTPARAYVALRGLLREWNRP